MNLLSRLKSGFKAHFASQVASMLTNAALLIVFTRFLFSPAEYGLLNLALSVLSVAAIFGNLGLPKSMARYVAEYVESDPGQVPRILSRTFGYTLALSVAACVIFAVLAGSIAGWIGEPSLAPLLVVGVGYVGFEAVYKYTILAFQGLNRVTWSSAVSAIATVGRFGFAVAFVFLGFGVVGALAGYIVSFAVAAAIGVAVLYARFYTGFDAADTLERGLSRRILRYSVPLTATRGANVLDKKVDMILVGALVGPVAVSYYALAKQIVGFITVPAISLGFTISPALAEETAGNRRERAARLYEQSLEHVLLLFVPATVGLVLVAGPLVRLVFGAKYQAAVPVLQVFAGFILVDAINQTTSDGLDYLGRARTRAVAKVGTAVGNFGLNLLLIPQYGAVGAAVATIVTSSLYVAVNVYSINDELSLRLGRLVGRVAVILGISVGMAVCVTVALPAVSNLLTLAGVIALGGGVWAALATVSGLLDVRRVLSLLT